jgi:hypothetical protein
MKKNDFANRVKILPLAFYGRKSRVTTGRSQCGESEERFRNAVIQSGTGHMDCGRRSRRICGLNILKSNRRSFAALRMTHT